MSVSDKSILVFDFGSYTTLLPVLVNQFSEVGYYCQKDSSYPKSANSQIGKGLKGVTWVEHFWDVVDDYDLIAFFDCHAADVQEYLKRQGKLVWGSGYGNELELLRYDANELLGKIGLPKVEMDKVIGITNLRKYLKENIDVYVKGMSRGNFESFHSPNYKLIEPMIDVLEHELGKEKDTLEFICCQPIDGDEVVEVGSDSYFIDGNYPQTLLTGYEIKDTGYAGVVKSRKDISKLLTEPLDKLSPTMDMFKYRGFYSTELRIKNKKSYLTDSTARAGSPPSELFCNMIENLGEVMYEGAQGNLVEPIYSDKYGVEAIIKSDFAKNNWQPIYFPEKIREFVKIKHHTIINNVDYYIPVDDIQMEEIGAVVATGKTLDEAIKKLKEYADKVEGYSIKINTDCSVQIEETIKKGEKVGIKFS